MNTAFKIIKSILSQKGGATAEFLISVPILLLMGLGGMQTIFFYDAKTTLSYATFEAAREGAVTHGQTKNMRNELGIRLAPIFGGDGTASEAVQAMAESSLEVNNPLFTKIEVLNPTREAFNDFGVENKASGKKEIPNDNLKFRSRSVGSTSGVNIQDANLLKIKVTYGYKLEVPLINAVLPPLMKWIDPANFSYYAAGRIPMTAVATVRMQTAAWLDNNASSTGGGSVGGTPPETSDPGESQPPGGDADNGDDSNSDDGSGEQAEGGVGQGGGDGATGSGSDNSDGSATDDDNQAGTGDGTPGNPPEDLACEQITPEEDTQGATGEDQGFWGDLWDGVKDALVDGYEFMKGFWEGIKDQLGDLTNMILHPIDTAKGLVELGKAFVEDPIGTAKMIGEALGEDFTKLTQCGAYDRGRVIGQYVNPVFMLKLATKLSKFGDLAEAIKKLKVDMPCASFAAGTQVMTLNGEVSIERVAIGSRVESRNDVTFIDSDQGVTNIFSRIVRNYHVLNIEGEQIQVTENHPLWVQGEGWTEVKDIERGSIVATAQGDARVLQNFRIDDPLKVFNFSVENTPSYFIGDHLVWAHNATIKCIEGNLKRRNISNTLSLKNQMSAAGIDIPDGYAAHHAIPVAVAEKSEALKYAAKKLGYDIENSNNGIALPTDPEVAQQVGLPVHNGKHTDVYNDYVLEQLKQLDEWWLSGADDVTEMELFNKIYEIENKIKADLQACTIACQKT